MPTEQELFEEAFRKCPAAAHYRGDFPKHVNGSYVYNLHILNFELWQAARAMGTNDAPQGYRTEKPDVYVARQTDKYYKEPKGAV